MMNSFLLYFTDPVLRAPTIGCMLMCLAASLVGVIVFLRKQSLLGESLSHASYPGVILGVIFAGAFSITEDQQLILSILMVVGAFLTALLGLWSIYFLEQKLRIKSDSALCFVLSSFFGIGLTLASEVQFSHTSLYRQVQVYLYGQAATMTDVHIWIYGVLCCVVLLFVLLLFKELQVMTFDRFFAKSINIQVNFLDNIFFVITVLAVVIGIRSVGVVLMSAMLIAPAIAARQYTNKLSTMLVLAALFGVISGYFGNYLSGEITHYLFLRYPSSRFSLPTGPMIVLIASLLCITSLLFAPQRGILLRLMRIARFRYQCLCENILKTFWRLAPDRQPVKFNEISNYQNLSSFYLSFILWRLKCQGWIKQESARSYSLTIEGEQWASQIVRLHRLWELYLTDHLGMGVEKVHRSAEEMEHIITPELEEQLTLLLKDPKKDPHHQIIPSKDRFQT